MDQPGIGVVPVELSIESQALLVLGEGKVPLDGWIVPSVKCSFPASRAAGI